MQGFAYLLPGTHLMDDENSMQRLRDAIRLDQQRCAALHLCDEGLISTIRRRLWNLLWKLPGSQWDNKGMAWTEPMCVPFRFPDYASYFDLGMCPGLVARGTSDSDDSGHVGWWRLRFPYEEPATFEGNQLAFETDLVSLRLAGFEDIYGTRHEFC